LLVGEQLGLQLVEVRGGIPDSADWAQPKLRAPDPYMPDVTPSGVRVRIDFFEINWLMNALIVPTR